MPSSKNIDALTNYIKQHENKDVLRFLTCGSVDDGKSTLIGRILYDTKLILDDQMSNLVRDSHKYGSTEEDIDFALLVDGLQSEREQGITIDVAYRFFTTDKRKFIVADTPGHEQYTRNMATGASNCDLAIILIDARKGVLPQSRRHSYIASLLGIKHIVVAINKIDLVDYSQEIFEQIKQQYLEFAQGLGFNSIYTIPVSARFGDNVINKSDNMKWYRGDTLLSYLENIEIAEDLEAKPFRMPVQLVNRPNLDFRGFAGTIASGTIKKGDEIIVSQSGVKSKVSEIYAADVRQDVAYAKQAVTIILEDEIDISRGDVLATPKERPALGKQFKANLIWMDDAELVPGRKYFLKCATKTVLCAITEIKHKVDINTFQQLAAKTLKLNEIAVVNIDTLEDLAIDAYSENKTTGSFIIIDRANNRTVGAGMVDFVLRRSTNVHWQSLEINKKLRSDALGQKPVILWFTGLSGAGKSTIANLVEKKLKYMGRNTYLLDGDNVRHGLNKDLGFTEADRVENIRRVAEVSKLMLDAGLIALVSFISPFTAERKMARDLVENGEFIEIYVKTTLEVAEQRDVKGLYKKARAGNLKNFTGIDSPYEEPTDPELVLDTISHSAEDLAQSVVDYLLQNNYF